MTSSERILITGASGFIGRVLCQESLRRGMLVRGATRSMIRLPAGTESVMVGLVDAKTDWTAALNGVEAVIHLAARVHVMRDTAAAPLAEFLQVNLHGTTNLARQAVRAGVRRLVYVSSIKVNGEKTAKNTVFSELNQADPQDPYAVSKWQAEQELHRIADETGLEVVVVRPPLVYGPEVGGNFARMLDILARGVPLPLASVHNRRDLVYVGNLVDALIACVMHPSAAGQTYLISDGEDVSTPDLLRRLGAALGYSARLWPCPQELLYLAGRLIGRLDQVERLLGSLQVDSSKIRRELNWVPPYTLQQGLQATAEWYRNTSL